MRRLGLPFGTDRAAVAEWWYEQARGDAPKTWPAGSHRRSAQTVGEGRDHNVGLLRPSCQVQAVLATPLDTAPHPGHRHFPF